MELVIWSCVGGYCYGESCVGVSCYSCVGGYCYGESCVGGCCYGVVWVVTDVELCGWLLLRRELCGWLLLWSCVGGYWCRVVWVVTVTESGLCWLRWLKGCVGGYCYGVRSVLTQVAEGLCGWLLLRSQVCVDSGGWRVVWVVTVTESGLCWLRWLKGCVGGYCYGVRSVLTQVAEGLCGWLLLRSQVCVDSGGWRVVWVVTVTESGLCWLRWLKGCTTCTSWW